METPVSKTELSAYRAELGEELQNILLWWMKFATDPRGGFVGRVDHDQNIYYEAPKGAVLNARILWSFSAGYSCFRNDEYLKHADEAYHYIRDHFVDQEFGGVFWTVDADGRPLSTRKQVYAVAFVIYALAEYTHASGSGEAKDLAIRLYRNLEEHSFDSERSGYLEAFNRDWTPVDDLRLSEKDANEKKTMNTHLHVLEAYTALARIWKDQQLKQQILNLVSDFREHIIRRDNHHLNLFMGDDWSVKSSAISFGHDIEASWLLLEAAEVLENDLLIAEVKEICVQMAKSAQEGMDDDGGMLYEFDPASRHFIREKHWWVQAEAMVGFFNAWQVSADDRFIGESIRVWEYVKANILDRSSGEWVWGRDENGHVMKAEDKAGLWKCPYHNSRACLELIKRINSSLSV